MIKTGVMYLYETQEYINVSVAAPEYFIYIHGSW